MSSPDVVEINCDNLILEIRDDIENERIRLPTLPEVALQVRDAVESESSNANSIAEMIAQDAALSARLLQVANSPLYRSANTIDSISMAVTRMGLKLVRSLVVSLAMKQLFEAKSESLNKYFRRTWDDAIQVAAISRVMATRIEGLEPEQAMLAGLIHNIGVLPILTKLDTDYKADISEELIDTLGECVAPEMGTFMLKRWRFSEDLAQVPKQSVILDRISGAVAEYADVVLVARVQHLTFEQRIQTEWDSIPAFATLGLDSQYQDINILAPEEEVSAVRSMLSA